MIIRCIFACLLLASFGYGQSPNTTVPAGAHLFQWKNPATGKIETVALPPAPNQVLGFNSQGRISPLAGTSVTWASVLDKPTFANVATSGAYADLLGRPTLGSLASQDGTLTDYLSIANAATTYVALGGSYVNPTWLTSLPWSKITSPPAFLLPGAQIPWTDVTGKPTFANVATTGAYSDLSGLPTLGTASAQNVGYFATAAQGALASTAVQPAALAGYQPLDTDLTNLAALTTTAFGRSLLTLTDASTARTTLGLVIGTNVQAYSAILNATTASFLTADETKLDGIAAGAEVNVNADWTAVSGDALILNKPTLGTASAQNVGYFATAAQGALADTAVQPAALTSYQPLDTDLTSIAASATTAFGRSLLTGADAPTTRTTLGLVIGTNVQAYDAILANTTASFTTTLLTKLNGIADGANNYVLPAPGVSSLGGVKRNTGLGGQFVTGFSVDGTVEYGTPAGSGDALTTGTLAQFAATTSAQLRGVLSNEDGTGNILTTNGSAASLTNFPTFNQNTTGSAATLTTPRAINGVAFDGSAPITVTAAAGTLTGTTLAAGVTGSSLTSLGTIGAGVWQGTAVADAYIASAVTWNAKQAGDVQLTSLAGLSYTGNPLKVVRVNAAETGFELATIAAGGGDAMAAGTLDQFADVTQTAGQTLSITSSTTLAGGTHSGNNSGDNAVNTLYSGLVSNATHTGDATGSTALTLATVNSNVGTFGSTTQVPQLTVNAKGLTTAVSNVTVTPAVGSITGLGTGVATALAINVGSAGAPIVNGGALGTPTSGNFGSGTFTWPTFNQNTSGNAATVTTNANLTGPVTSVGNATAIANGAITNAMLANAAVANLTGTNSGDNAANSSSQPVDAQLTSLAGLSYAGNTLKVIRVNAGGTDFELATVAGGGGGDALVAGTLDQFADVTQTAGQTLSITSSTTLAGGTQSGNNSGDNAVNSLYSGLVSNATHTGDATGSTALSVVRIQGVDIPAPIAGDNGKAIKYNHGTGDFEYGTAGGGAGVTVSDTPPGSPSGGDLWWDSVSGELNIYYNDGTSSQWIAVVSVSGTVRSVATAGSVNGLTLTGGTIVDTGTITLGGTLSGTAPSLTAGNVTTNANLTGPVTSVGNATAIANGTITNAMLANGAVANLTGTNSGDNAVNTLYSGLVSNATHTGDATGATALTLATVNSNVGSFGSATQTGTYTVNAKGLITAASNVTITPAVGSITGLGTGIAAALATNTGSAGAPVLVNGAGGTPSTLTLTNATGLPTAGMLDASVTLAKMANLAQDQFIGRTTASTGVPQTATITAAARTVLDDATVGAMLTTMGGAPLASPTFTGTVGGITSAMVGLGNVDNTSDANKPVSTATQTALNLKANLASPTFTGTVTLPSGQALTAPALGTPASGNFSTGVFTWPTFNQSTTGNAATVTTNANLTGPVTSVGNATAIANGAITNAMLANAAVANLSGTNSGDNAANSSSQPVDAQLTSLAALAYAGNTLKVVRVNAGGTDFELATIAAGGGDAVVSGTLDQFADVTQTAGQTLAITSSTTLAGGTQSGNNSGDNAVNTLYSGLVSNATHTGDATGSTALSVVRIQGVDIPAPIAGDDGKAVKYNHTTGDFEYGTVSGGSSSVTISATPPGSPTAGDLWWDSDVGNLFILFNDGSSSQWVAAALSGGGLTKFSETLNTSAPNATVNSVQFAVASGSTNANLVLTPKGTGGFILGAPPDNTSTGGNIIGVRAVDLQLTHTANSRVASGQDSFAVGDGNSATQQGSFAGGVGNLVTGVTAVGIGNGNSASSTGSVAIGFGNTASGAAAAAFGQSNTASNNRSIAIGFNNTSSGSEASVAIGNANTANAIYSQAFGYQALASRYAQSSHASGQFAAVGDAQAVKFVARNKTTTNAAVELFLDGSSLRLTVTSGRVLSGTVEMVGVKSDGTAVARYSRQVTIKNVAGTTSLVGSVIALGTDEIAGTSILISADNTNDALKIEATGIAAETWRWVATMNGVEVAYGN
jgi:hypothetical protein